MILVTVGTQLPFDRLLEAVDDWALQNPGQEIIAQIGVSKFMSPRFEIIPIVDTATFKKLAKDADVLVAHAGMGSILTAIEMAKPVIIMPRRADLGEHRNDHQLATAEKLAHLSNVRVVHDPYELALALSIVYTSESRSQLELDISESRGLLVNEIRNFISSALLGSQIP